VPETKEEMTMVDLGEISDTKKSSPFHPLIDVSAPEVRALQLLMNDKPNQAQSVISQMAPKDRAIFAFYLRELGYMVETADQDARG